MNKKEELFWNAYLETLSENPVDPKIEIGIAGNDEIADSLLGLYLEGKKTAGSGLVKDYEICGDSLPEVGDFWMILDSRKEPKCIVKTKRVEINLFGEMPVEVAVSEGEGDLSLEYWTHAHREFFSPFLESWGIENLDAEKVVTEFYDLVFQST